MTEARARVAANIRAWAIGYYGFDNFMRMEAKRAAAQKGGA